MITSFEDIERRLHRWARDHGIEVQDVELPAGTAGQFNGVNIRMNTTFSSEERVYYLAHALGSIAIWSLHKDTVQAMFAELRAAKESLARERLLHAIDSFRDFEINSSEYAVWLLRELDSEWCIATYTNFMRADLESMIIFHTTDRAPVWSEFFGTWNREVREGKRQVRVFSERAVPEFRAVRIEQQEILQAQ